MKFKKALAIILVSLSVLILPNHLNATSTGTKVVYVSGYGNVTMHLHHKGDQVINIATSKATGGGTYWSGPHGHFFEGNVNSTINPIVSLFWWMQQNDIVPVTLSWKEGWPGTYGAGSSWAPYGHIGIDMGFWGNAKIALPETEWVGEMDMANNYKQVIVIDPDQINNSNPFYYGIGHSTYIANGGHTNLTNNQTFIGRGFSNGEIRVQGATYVNPQTFHETALYVSPNTPLVLNYNNGNPNVLFISPQGFPLGGRITISDYNKIRSRSQSIDWKSLIGEVARVRNTNPQASSYRTNTYYSASVTSSSSSGLPNYKNMGLSYISSKHLNSSATSYYKSNFTSKSSNYSNSSNYNLWKTWFNTETNINSNKNSAPNVIRTVKLTTSNYNNYLNNFNMHADNFKSKYGFNVWKSWFNRNVLTVLKSDGHSTISQRKLANSVSNFYSSNFDRTRNGINYKSVNGFNLWKVWFNNEFNNINANKIDGQKLIESNRLSWQRNSAYTKSLTGNNGFNYSGNLIYTNWKNWFNRNVMTVLKQSGTEIINGKKITNNAKKYYLSNFTNTSNGINFKNKNSYIKWVDWINNETNPNTLKQMGIKFITDTCIGANPSTYLRSFLLPGNGENFSSKYSYNSWLSSFRRVISGSLKNIGINFIKSKHLHKTFEDYYISKFVSDSRGVNHSSIENLQKWAAWFKNQFNKSEYKSAGLTLLDSLELSNDKEQVQINKLVNENNSMNISCEHAFILWKAWIENSLSKELQEAGNNLINSKNLTTATKSFYVKTLMIDNRGENYKITSKYLVWKADFENQTDANQNKQELIDFIYSSDVTLNLSDDIKTRLVEEISSNLNITRSKVDVNNWLATTRAKYHI